MISQEDINKVLDANDIVAIAADCVPDLKQKGGRYVACCPFHKEKTPSFQIDQNKQLWHCFGCGEGGNIVNFVEKIYDMNFVEAMNFLADKANIQLKNTSGPVYDKSDKGRLMDACKHAAEFYHNQLTRVKNTGSDNARTYLSKRNLGSEIAKRWNLGYAPGNNQLVKYLTSKKVSAKDMIDANLAVRGKDGLTHDRFYNRVMFPICDIQGDYIAFGGRIMTDEQPKYLNTGETPLFHKSKVLYGLDKAKSNMTSTGMAVVVEGYTDVIAMHEAGLNYAVATLGTALTQQHIRILNQHAKKKIVYLFDGDQAGQRAAERALNFIDEMDRPEIHGKRAKLLALTLPDNMDPKEFIDEKGVDELKKLIDNAKPLIQYGIERKISQYDLNEPGNKSKAANAALQVLAPIKDSLIAKEYCSMIAEMTGIRTDDLIPQLSRLKAPNKFDPDFVDKKEVAEQEFVFMEPVNNKVSKLEKELLCILAKNPEYIKEIMSNSMGFVWTVESHEKLFEYMLDAIKENPSIEAKELIMKIHQKNAKTANMLTNISGMHDIKTNPVKHGKYLIAKLRLETISSEIANLRKEYANITDEAQADETFCILSDLQKTEIELRAKLKGMI